MLSRRYARIREILGERVRRATARDDVRYAPFLRLRTGRIGRAPRCAAGACNAGNVDPANPHPRWCDSAVRIA